MVESRKNTILSNRNTLFSEATQRGFKKGTEIEKGVAITEEYLNEHFEEIGKMMQIFSVYPDCYIDLITPEDDNINLFFYQRIFLRAVMRFTRIYVTACRAWSKSFITILGLMLQCIFIPGRKVFICAPNKTQGAQIAKEKITEIYRHWPLIRKEVIGGDILDMPGNFGKDYVTIKFRNGSQFDLVGALESSLGGRRHGGLIDEIKNHDEEMINTVVLPLLNVSRRMPNNEVNPKEPNQQVICATSAWQKTSFAYSRLIDDFEKSIINPKEAFVFGCDYRVPMMHGLVEKKFINDLKLSPSFNEATFATEYLSFWQGSSEESWFNYDKLTKYRKLKNPEWQQKYRDDSNIFYFLSMDVGRIHDQSPVCVFRVNITKNKFQITLVNLIVLGRTPETKTFSAQARDLKELIAKYRPKGVIIDLNGLGMGIGDEMIKQQIGTDGSILPPYCFVNDDTYRKVQPKDGIHILYSMKANGTLKSQINGNAYAMLNSGRVHFLIKEQEAKSALLATETGRKMSTQKRIERLMPHEMTTRLFDEMANLRIKKAGMDIVLEPINTHYPDDKYYSFAYGLWQIKQLEEEYYKKNRRLSKGPRRLVFYSGGENN